jgi:nickel-dependent lactate racemase
MPDVVLKYAGEGLNVSLPDTPNFAGVLEPKARPVIADPSAAIQASLRDPIKAHLRGASELEPFCTTYLDEPLDFVVTTNAGAPLDVNLYQTSKGIAGVAPVLRDGGEIVVASRCPEGLGSKEFIDSMDEFTTPAEWIRRALAHEFFYPDQWCAQEIYKWMDRHPIHLYSEGVTDGQQKKYGFVPTHDIERTVTGLLERHGTDARWAVVPDGPYVILRLRDKKALT